MKVHRRCHTGEKPYTCVICAYATITKRNLDRHIYNNHVKGKDGPNKRYMVKVKRSRYRPFATDAAIINSQIASQERAAAFDRALEAITSGDINAFTLNISFDVAKLRDSEGRSLLQLANESGINDICKYLIQHYRSAFTADEVHFLLGFFPLISLLQIRTFGNVKERESSTVC